MKLGENLSEKPPLDETPPQYCSTIDLTGKCKSEEGDNVSVKCEGKHKRKRVCKIVGVVVGVIVALVIVGVAVKFAVRGRHHGRDDEGEMETYAITVKNTSGNYQAYVAADLYRRVLAFRDTKLPGCFMYFPDVDMRDFHKALQEGDGDGDHHDDEHKRDMPTITYLKTEEPGYNLALRVIREPVSERVLSATAGAQIAQFCNGVQGYFLEDLYGPIRNEDRHDDKRNMNMCIVMS